MRRHLLLLTFTLILSHFSISNLWAGEQYIFPVTAASTVSGGTLNQDATTGQWYATLTNYDDYVDIPFTWDQSGTECLIKIGYTTAVSGGQVRLWFYRGGSDCGSFGEHGIEIASVITEKDCGAQLTTSKIDGCKPYVLRIKPAASKTMNVYYLKVETNNVDVQSTAGITAADLNLVYSSTVGDGIPSNSDFLYSHKSGEKIKIINKDGKDRMTATNGYITVASRKLYTFETGTYKFKFNNVFTEESNTYAKPCVFVNNVAAGGGTYYFNKDDGSAGGKYRDWEVEIDVAAGTYPVEFYFPNSNEKLFYTTVTVTKNTPSCPGYTFHYGTSGQSNWVTPLCFTQVDATTEWQITDFVIPNKPNWYVGYQGVFKGSNDLGTASASSSETNWPTTMYLAPAMDPSDESGTPKVGSSAAGAIGTIRIYSNSNWNNLYAAFVPDGYGITYGGTGHAFTETATSNMWETDYLTLPDVSSTYYMGMETETEGTYVKYGKSKSPDEAISNMGVTVKGNGGKAIYLVPGSFNADGAKYAVYDVTNSSFDTDFMSDTDGDGIYVGYVGDNCASIVLCRMKSDATTTDLANKNWDGARWNQTGNISISGDLAKKYTITNLDGNNCSYSTDNMQPITGQKGKFRMWANSKADNWFVHWIPYYTLSYDGNGGSGSTAQTERNSESSTTTVTVASNSFTAPTGKHFIGWAISQANADAGTVDYAAGASYTLTSNATLYAVWAWDTYTITYNAGTGVITGSHANDTKTYGVNLTLPGATFSKTGYTQTGWATTEGGSQAYALSGSYTENDAAELYPVWTAKTTTITIDANTTYHGSTTPGTVTATWGSVLPSFTAASGAVGYDLDGYYTAATGGAKIINADGTLVASTAYTTADSKWNSESGSVTLYAQYELALSYCDFATGHENNANFGDANGRCLISIEPTGNTNEYRLTLKPNTANGNTSKLDYLYVIASGNSPYPAEAGTDEGGVSYDELSVTFSNSNASATFTIQWSTPGWDGRWQCTPEVIFSKIVACDHNVIYSAPSNGSYTIQVGDGVASGANKTAATGETITLEATPSSGYTFGGWTITKTSDGTDVTASVGLSGTSTATFTMPAYDVTVAATFEVDPCSNSLTIQCTSGYVPVTTYNADPYTENKHETYVVTTNDVSAYYYPLSLSSALSTFSLSIHMANSQNNFAWWNIYKKTDNNSGDVEYAGAFYNKVGWQHMVVSNDWNSGEFDDAITSFNDGQQGVGSSIPAGDYLIGLSAKNDARFYYFTLTASENIFCPAPTYDVTITGSPAAGQASATGDGSYEEGETVTINATPNRGYSFNTWSADPSVSFSSAATTASNSFSMPASDVALTASYTTLTSRTVTVNNDGNGSGSADLNPAYVGETVTLTATPNTGYRFVEWTTSDGVSFASSTSASTTFTMLDKNVTVQANFELVDNVIASGNANTMTGSYHDDQGSTLSGENVDADCVFDHNVFKFTYTGFDGTGKYYGMDITKEAGYNSSLSDGATGIGFYYKTESDDDGLAFCLDPKGSGGDKQYKMQLDATDGVWTYVYVAHSEADEWDGTFRFWINSNDYATDGGAATSTQQASGHFYIADISATAVTSKSSISPYTVTAQANNGSYGSVTGSGSYFDCETVSITATPNAGYRFVNWTTSDGVTFASSTSASTTFSMLSKNVTVQANFEAITVNANREDLDECRVLSVLGTTKYTPMGIQGNRGWGGDSGEALTIGDKGSNNVWHIYNGTSSALHLQTESDVREYNKIHLEVWTADAMSIQFGLLCFVNSKYNDNNPGEGEYVKQTISTTAATWKSVDYTLTNLTTSAYLANATDLYFYDLASKDVYVTNVYFYNDDATKPVITAATNSGVTGTDLTLTLTATYKGNALKDFRITNTTTSQVYDRTANGSNQVTIPDIEYCESYNLEIQAIYNSCILSDATEMTVSGNALSAGTALIATDATISADATASPAAEAIDNNTASRWASGASATDVPHYILVDLGTIRNVSSMKIGWEYSNPSDYYIEGSVDGTNYYPLKHETTVPPNGSAEGAAFNDYDTYTFAASVGVQYLKVRSVTNKSGYGMSIWEMQAYGQCYSASDNPVTTYAQVASQAANGTNTAVNVTLDLGAYDYETAFSSMYYKITYTPEGGAATVLDNQTASSGQYVLNGLEFSTTYTVRVQARDANNGNLSDNYVEFEFTTPAKQSTLFLRNSMNWQDGGLNTDYRFSYVSSGSDVLSFTITPNSNELQYRPYNDANNNLAVDDSEISGGGFCTPGNQFINGQFGNTVTFYAKDKEHFVSTADLVYVVGSAVKAEVANALQMHQSGTTYYWEGPVTVGNKYKIIVKAQESNNIAAASFTDHSCSRIMADSATFTNSEGYGYAKLTFDMTTWEYEWTEADTFIFDNNAGGGDGKWSTASNWMNNALPTIDKNVIIRAEVEVDITNARAKSVVIDQNGSNTGQLVLGAGNELVVATTVRKTTDGETYGATDENDIVFNSDASNGLGALVMGTHDGTNKATVNFYTLSHGSSGSSASVNQYVGTPFNDETNILYNWYNSWVYGIVYNGSGNIGWERVNEGSGMTPFKGYTVISADPEGHSYWQQGTLNSSNDVTIEDLNYKTSDGSEPNNENLLANSWMAPIKIHEFDAENDFTNTDATIYIFNSTSPVGYESGGFASNYVTYSVNTATDDEDVIPAMQSFSVFTNKTGGSSVKLNYKRLVYDPAVATGDDHATIIPNKAPQRRTSAEEANKLRLYVQTESGYGDMVYMWEHPNFAEGFENGWDGRKVFGEPVAPQLYAVTPDGNMAVNCVPDFEGTLLGFQAGTSANSYTFTFEYTDEAEKLYLRDIDNNTYTRVLTGNSYPFTTSDRDVHNRFILTKNAPQSPTDIAETGDGLPVTGARKVIINDHVYVIRGGKMFSVDGQLVK